MPDILLTAINANYAHAAFGLRYLMANLGPLAERALIREYTIRQSAEAIVQDMVGHHPKVIGIGVYIWNATLALEVVERLKADHGHIRIVLGGPEVSYEMEAQKICHLADLVIGGEADLLFAELCADLLAGTPTPHWITAPLPSMDDVELPYALYTDEDLTQRMVYVEASRGCPFKCQFCLSSLDVPVRKPNLDAFLAAMQNLLDRGLCHFKFVDRTFNLSTAISGRILDFFLERYTPHMFLHFEMIPDRLPAALKERIRAFPPGALQFEVGIQTFNSDVAARIERRQNTDKTAENLRFLREKTGVHVHADLIAGLPGESLDSFAAGFDRLVALGPQEIQVGILKRLRGTPIIAHDDAFSMVYSPEPPYIIQRTAQLTQAELSHLNDFARLWDRIANNGYFSCALPFLTDVESPFAVFSELTRWMGQRIEHTYGLDLNDLERHVYTFLTEERHLEPVEVAEAFNADRIRLRRSIPKWLKRLSPPPKHYEHSVPTQATIPKRQARHLAR